MVIWRFTDGKPGHEAQSKGLVQSLLSLQGSGIEVFKLDCSSAGSRSERRRQMREMPTPDLLIGAGHATHLPLLFSKWKRGGRAVVLMKPTLPTFLFDLCIVPEHDAPQKRSNIEVTLGVLNDIQPSLAKDKGRGLFLIGGPCRHVEWRDGDVVNQVVTLCGEFPLIQWTLTTSRRTPSTFLQLLKSRECRNLEIVPVEATQPGWVGRHLASVFQVWVTPDSVSMMFEALTSGAAVGELDLFWKPGTKLKQAVETLIAQGRVTPFIQRVPGEVLSCAQIPLNESARCADIILNKWFENKSKR